MNRPGRPSSVIWLIANAPPPMPKCWTNLQDWQGWLSFAHMGGEPQIARREDRGGYSTERVVRQVFVKHIDHCFDCPAKHRQTMAVTGRCFPSVQQFARDAALQPAAAPAAPHETADAAL